MSDPSELRTWVRRVGARHGFGSPGTARSPQAQACEPVRPSEVIAGSASSQNSCGDITDETAAEGQEFTTGTRENAYTDDHDQTGECYGSGSNPMQSPDLGGRIRLRYGIGFLCANYPPGHELPEVGGYQSPRSLYQQAFRGMNKTKHFNDPTSAQILAGIREWTDRLARELNGCDQGQLVVSFQGHGVRGTILGVDLVPISPSQLHGLFRRAESQRVTVTYVPDACESGHAVPRFQNHAADHVDRNVVATEDAGQESSQENHETAQRLRDMMAHARELIQLSQAIGRHGRAMIVAARAVEVAPEAAKDRAWNGVMSLNQTILRDVQAMQYQFETNMDFGNDPELHLETIDRAFATLLGALNAVQPRANFDLGDNWCGKVGAFQDTVSDGTNRIIQICNRRAREYTNASR